MQCEEVRDQFTDYLAGSLAESVRSDVQQHLIECESCREEAQDLSDIWLKLDTIPAERLDGDAMRARFEVMLDAYRQGMDHAPSLTVWARVNKWIGRVWPTQPALQFAFSLAMVIVGVVIGRQYQPAIPAPGPANPPIEVSQLREEVHSMRQMVALALLQQQSASERLRGVSFSNQIEQPDTEILTALMDALMRDENVNVRLAAVDALKKFGDRQLVKKGVLQALETQNSPFVHVALIDYVVEMRETESIDTLRKLAASTDAHENVRQRAEWGLENLQ